MQRERRVARSDAGVEIWQRVVVTAVSTPLCLRQRRGHEDDGSPTASEVGQDVPEHRSHVSVMGMKLINDQEVTGQRGQPQVGMAHGQPREQNLIDCADYNLG